jgi:hypothetical protein
MPSRNEPFGIVVLEAWSAGKPILASQNGGPAEYVRHEVNGLKIYPSPESVVWGVDHMLSDLDRARWMGQNGRKAVQERFTWDTITEQMLVVYEGLCPSPVVLPHQAADRVPVVLAESSHETSWAGTLDENLLAVIGKQGTYGLPIDVQAKLHFRAADLEGEADDALTACQSSLARSGLNPQRQDHTLIVKGEWATVLAALNHCGQYVQRVRVHREQQADIEVAAVPVDDLVSAARQAHVVDCIMVKQA